MQLIETNKEKAISLAIKKSLELDNQIVSVIKERDKYYIETDAAFLRVHETLICEYQNGNKILNDE